MQAMVLCADGMIRMANGVRWHEAVPGVRGPGLWTTVEKMKRDPVWSARMGHRNAETWRSEAIKRGK